MADTSNKKNIREESLRDLSDFLTAQGEKAFRAKQKSSGQEYDQRF